MSLLYRLPMFACLVVLFMAAAAGVRAEVGDTTTVRVFDSYLWTNHGGQDRRAEFPDSSVRHEKIAMHFRLKCPPERCGEWDYTMSVHVLRGTGVRDSAGVELKEQIEIARFITPYGKWFAAGREFDWVYDVTDYKSLLHDSAEIRVFYDGWSQGSLFTLDFDFIEGTPARDVFRVQNLYTGGFGYGDPNNSIENHLRDTTITVDPASTNTTLKITTTGHGFGGTDNAAEFSDKTHTIEVNGVERFSQHLWRDDCGQNPVYPQAGTWYYQRAGWCPGDIVHPDFYDLTPYATAGGPITIDYDMQEYVNADLSKPATYIVHAQVHHATGPNFENNVAVDAIVRPSKEFRYSRMNPICASAAPIVVLTNRGSAPLTRAQITYGVEGREQRTFNWTGNVAFMKSVEVELPSIDLGATAGTFVVSVSEPNGVADEYQRDNAMTAAFDVPKVSSARLFLSLRTDDFFDDAQTTNGISWEVLDASGAVVYSRDGFNDRTIYRDTFQLQEGCYRFVITDDYFGDGLIPIRGAAGSYTLRDDKGVTIINGAANGPDYRASFGDREVTSFVVSTATSIETRERPGDLDAIAIYPNPSSGVFTVEIGARTPGSTLTLTVTGLDGSEILRRTLGADATTATLDLSAHPAGTYVVRIDGDGGSWLRKVILEAR